MELTGTDVKYGMTAAANPSSVQVTGGVTIGTSSTNLSYTVAPNIAYSLALQIAGGQSLVLNTLTGAITGEVAGARQLTTATVTGSISSAGNASVTFKSAKTGSIIVTVAVLAADTAAMVAAKIITALQANAVIVAAYNIAGTGSSVTAQSQTQTTNDSTLNIAIRNGTASGLTENLISTATTSGILPTTAFRINGSAWSAVDFEGVQLPTMAHVNSLLIRHFSGNGSALVANDNSDFVINIYPASFNLSAYGSANHPASASNLTFSASEDVTLHVDIHAKI